MESDPEMNKELMEIAQSLEVEEKETTNDNNISEVQDNTNTTGNETNEIGDKGESKTGEKNKKDKKKKEKKEKKKKDKEKDNEKEQNDETLKEREEITNAISEVKKDKKKKKKDKDKDKDSSIVSENISKRNKSTSKEKPKKKKKSNSSKDDKDKTQQSNIVPPSKKPKKVSKIKNDENEKDSNQDQKTIVFNYLLNQNRPYSVINIYDNLHGQIKKTQLQRILDSLTNEEKIICKEYNTKIYLVNQNNFPPIEEEALKELDKQIEEKRKEIAELKETLQSKQNELKKITAVFTDEELAFQIKETTKELSTLKVKTDKIKNNSYELIPVEKMVEAEKKFDEGKNKYKKIKRICLDILDQLAEGMEIKTEKLMEDIGIENDSDLLKRYQINNLK